VVAEPLSHRLDGPDGAPVIVLSHALGSSSEMWDEVVAPLQTRYRLVRPDTRGHGRSPAPLGPYAIADLVADQLALLDELAIARASFAVTREAETFSHEGESVETMIERVERVD